MRSDTKAARARIKSKHQAQQLRAKRSAARAAAADSEKRHRLLLQLKQLTPALMELQRSDGWRKTIAITKYPFPNLRRRRPAVFIGHIGEYDEGACMYAYIGTNGRYYFTNFSGSCSRLWPRLTETWKLEALVKCVQEQLKG